MQPTENGMVWIASLLLLARASFLCFGLEVKRVILDSKELCEGSSPQTAEDIYWASEKVAILVIGRSRDTAAFHDCSVTVGAATKDSLMLRLSFDAFHVNDCGVVLSINQSSQSDFRKDNTPMARIGCDHGNVKLLHSEPKHYVRIHVHKSTKYFQGYNFRINITVTDSIPETGPATHVVVIVGIVSLFVVAVALWLLVKYLLRRRQHWNEQCTERNMERAIHLYNNQEIPAESDYMYTALPAREAVGQPASTSHRNGHGPMSKKGGARVNRHRAGEIAFVHADGHIETFRMRGPSQESQARNSNAAQPAALQRASEGQGTNTGSSTNAETVGDNFNEEEDEILGECPPSYEEALDMPTPDNPQGRHYVNFNSKLDDNHAG